jgi:hypothetical protein
MPEKGEGKEKGKVEKFNPPALYPSILEEWREWQIVAQRRYYFSDVNGPTERDP